MPKKSIESLQRHFYVTREKTWIPLKNATPEQMLFQVSSFTLLPATTVKDIQMSESLPIWLTLLLTLLMVQAFIISS